MCYIDSMTSILVLWADIYGPCTQRVLGIGDCNGIEIKSWHGTIDTKIPIKLGTKSKIIYEQKDYSANSWCQGQYNWFTANSRQMTVLWLLISESTKGSLPSSMYSHINMILQCCIFVFSFANCPKPVRIILTRNIANFPYLCRLIRTAVVYFFLVVLCTLVNISRGFRLQFSATHGCSSKTSSDGSSASKVCC